jgi:hypothetical protein
MKSKGVISAGQLIHIQLMMVEAPRGSKVDLKEPDLFFFQIIKTTNRAIAKKVTFTERPTPQSTPRRINRLFWIEVESVKPRANQIVARATVAM